MQTLELYLKVLPEAECTAAVKALITIILEDALHAIDCAFVEGQNDPSAQ